jgi:putative FmdB family regulatory protein
LPIYSYRCGSCSNEFELRQGFDAEPKQECPVCKNTAQRRIHAAGVIYKGSGFYSTDYARKSDSSKSSSRDSDSKDSDSKDSGSKKGIEPKGASAKSSESKGSSEAASAKSSSD